MILVIWKNLEYNIGNAFEETKGTFTCPHDGIYSFYATSLVWNDKSGRIHIYVNGSNTVQQEIYNGYGDISSHGVFKLKKGDSVHIYMNGYFHYANSNCHRTFLQGHLIDLL